MQDYSKLLVWQKARSLTVVINELSRPFRPGDAPGLRSQLMRATMSISATIAEGAGRESRRDFARFISMAIASASEVEHHLRTAADLGIIGEAPHARGLTQCIEVRRMLYGLRRALVEAEANERAVRIQKAPPSSRLTEDSITRRLETDD
jgi:four helix bundle protein